jgi:hypothetical protein
MNVLPESLPKSTYAYDHLFGKLLNHATRGHHDASLVSTFPTVFNGGGVTALRLPLHRLSPALTPFPGS